VKTSNLNRGTGFDAESGYISNCEGVEEEVPDDIMAQARRDDLRSGRIY
jgi:hypothetical protein